MASPFAFTAGLVRLAALAFVGVAARAQSDAPWLVRVWTADGLSDRNLTSVAQTEDKFLWISHGRGIARFDGVRFEEFRLSTLAPVRDGGVRLLLASGRGGLWIVTNHGEVIRISAKGLTLAADEIPDGYADAAAEDAEGALWLSFPSGALFRVKDGVVTRPAAEAGLTETRTYFAADPNGRLWAVQNNEIGVLEGERFEKQRQRILPSSRIAPAAGGGVWVVDSRALFHCSEKGELKRFAGPSGGRFGGNPSAILEDRTGAVWFGARPDGLYRYTPADGLRRIATSSPDVTGLLEDHEGSIWVATLGGGLNRVSPRAIAVEGSATGFPNESIRSLCEDRDGGLWATTLNGLLMTRAGTDWKTDAGWPTRVTCVAADPQGGVWIGTRQKMLHRLREGRLETWTAAQGLNGNTMVALLVGRDGTLWIGEDGGTGLQAFRGGGFRAFELPAQTRRLQAMTEDRDGRIWLGFEQGMLLRVEGDKLVNVTPADAPPIAIHGLHATPDGTLWIGYDGAGIGRWKDGRFALLRAEQGLFSDHVAHLISDARGWLWCGGDEGVFKVRLQALADLAEGRETRVKSVHFGPEAGIPERLVATKPWGGPLRTRDGRVWMPMGALLTIDPARGSDARELPPALVTQVRADGQLAAYYASPLPATARPLAPGGRSLPLRAALELAPVRQKIEFAFTAPSFAAPENLHFRHQLAGFDDGWIESGTARTASYPRVPAGSYRFRVQASGSDGVWNEADAAVAFSVAPFYWQTWWFRLAVLGVFTGATVAIVRSVSHRRLRRQLQVMQQRMTVERERARIARDLHDDAGNRLTRIMLLARLAMRHREQPEKTAAHLEQLSTAAREVTDALDEIVWAVNPRHDTLPDFIAYLGHCAVELLQAASIACIVEAPEHPPARSIGADARHNLFLAVKEALNNVVRHSGATEMRLTIASDDRALVVTVHDNGRGLGAAPADPGADGLSNMRLRMEQIGGRLEIHSTSGEGARLSFTYPWPETK